MIRTPIKEGDRLIVTDHFRGQFPKSKAHTGISLWNEKNKLVRVKFNELKTPWTLHVDFVKPELER